MALANGSRRSARAGSITPMFPPPSGLKYAPPHGLRPPPPPPLHHEKAELMRSLPLSDADRGEMLRVIGAGSIDELFRDVPEEARLTGPIHGLPNHQSELAVERHMAALARKNMVAG